MADDTPDIAAPAEPDVERTQKFFDLLIDVGVADILDQALSARTPEKRSGKSDWTAAAEEADEDMEATVAIDLAPMFLAVMRAGAVRRLADIVLDGTPEQISRAPMSAVREGLRFFVSASMQLVGVLLGFGNGLASPKRPSGATSTPSVSTSS